MVAITDITDGTVTGTGYFDLLMQAISAQLQSQLNNGSITHTDYATVYLGALQSALAQAIQFAMVVEQVDASIANTIIANTQSNADVLVKQETVAASLAKRTAEIALLAQKTLTEIAKIRDVVDSITVYAEDSNGNPTTYTGAIGKQQALHRTQASGFLRDAEQKATKILMDAWSVTKSVSGDIIETPDGARNDDMEDLIIKLRQGVGVTTSIYKLEANAGSNKTVTNGAYTTLDGSGSTAPYDDTTAPEVIVTYAWVQLSGTPISITNSNEEIASITAPAVSGTASDNILTFQLTITSDLGAIRIDTVEIIVE